MPDVGSTPQTEAIAQAHAKSVQLAASFSHVFGYPNKRDEHQKRVMQHLAVCAGDGKNAYQFQGAADGIALIAAGIHRDGAQSILRIIDRQLEISKNAGKKPVKPAVKK